ncbi:flagellar hook-associated protein 2 [Polymorphobacter glacialis]|uniref:Flagellar hook-associated protein 2 n=1 Tax=Sandarakinorhabdus glacialis TaxID=1614636 RepID=A0A917A0L3_9SPHN|nr:flagellar hook-associated protein 2 [Polymorphobacter glacialis]
MGAGSGIDTKALIDELVAAEKAARTTPLTTRTVVLDAQISALGQLRSAMQTIAGSLDARVKDGTLGLVPVSNSAAVAIERVGTGPATAFVSSISVNRLASAQVLTAPALTAGDAPVGLGTLTIQMGTRTDLGGGDFSFAGAGAAFDVVIGASNNSLVGLRDAINRCGAGVSAAIVSNNGTATLSLRGADGTAGAFIVSAAEDAGAPGLARFAYTPGARPMTLAGAAGNAELSLDGIAVSRASNVIDDLVTGVRLRLAKADPAVVVTVSASRDGAALAATISDFAVTLGAMRGLIGDFRKGAVGTDAPGALANDPTARAMDQRIAGLAAAAIPEANGLRLRDLGVNINRDGSITFDAARFAALSPTRYADAEALLKTLAAPSLSTQPNRLQSIAAMATPATAGLTRRRGGLATDLAKVDVRLATYRATLVRQYSAMERMVAASKAVQAQLEQQIAAWNNQGN